MATVTTQKQLYESMMSIIQRTTQGKSVTPAYGTPDKSVSSINKLITPENTNKKPIVNENVNTDLLPPSLGQPRVIIKIL